MLKYVLHRFLVALGTILVIALLTFLAMTLVPGDPAVARLGDQATPEQIAALRRDLGLDQPFLVQFFHWVLGAVQGDLGVSYINGQSVGESLAARSVITVSIAVVTTIVTSVIGVAVGTWAAFKGGKTDKAVLGITSVGLAIPNFWAGVILAYLLAVWLPLLPANGWTNFGDDPSMWLKGMVLPVAALGIAIGSTIARQARGAVRDVLSRDFIRSLRASGLPMRKIVLKHTLRNAAIPIVTVIGVQFALLLGGTIVIEQVFALPGLGSLAINAVLYGDLPVIQGVIVLVAVMILAVNFFLDLVYGWLNPKVRLA